MTNVKCTVFVSIIQVQSSYNLLVYSSKCLFSVSSAVRNICTIYAISVKSKGQKCAAIINTFLFLTLVGGFQRDNCLKKNSHINSPGHKNKLYAILSLLYWFLSSLIIVSSLIVMYISLYTVLHFTRTSLVKYIFKTKK